MNNYSKQLRQLFASKDIIVAPGVYDGMSALVVKQAGFPIIYVSGGAIARSYGYPDIGLVTITEFANTLANIVEVTQMPVIADADTGFGNAINVSRTVKIYEQLGIAGLHIEDQTFPKRCGHLNDKTIISLDEMCHKIRVAKNAARNPDFVIIARTDAIAISGLDEAIKRANQYVESGADMIFVEAPETIDQMKIIAREVKGLKLINMFIGGKTPLVPVEDLQKMGYKLVIVPSDLQRSAIKAMQDVAAEIYKVGNSKKLAGQMVSFNQREAIVDTKSYLINYTDNSEFDEG